MVLNHWKPLKTLAKPLKNLYANCVLEKNHFKKLTSLRTKLLDSPIFLAIIDNPIWFDCFPSWLFIDWLVLEKETKIENRFCVLLQEESFASLCCEWRNILVKKCDSTPSRILMEKTCNLPLLLWAAAAIPPFHPNQPPFGLSGKVLPLRGGNSSWCRKFQNFQKRRSISFQSKSPDCPKERWVWSSFDGGGHPLSL